MQNTGQYIRELRVKKGIGSQELASHLELLPEALYLIETNRLHATKNQIFSIAAYLGADENDLLRTYQRNRILSEIKGDRKSGETVQVISPDYPYAGADLSKRHRRMLHDFIQLYSGQAQIKIHKPSPPLNNWIECILYCKDHQLGHSFENVLPDGMIQLMIELDGFPRKVIAGHTYSSGSFVKNGWVSGIQGRPVTYDLKESRATVYIRFRAGGFFNLTGIPPAELENNVVEADLILDSSFLGLREELLDCCDVQTMFKKIESYFLIRIGQNRVLLPVVRYFLENIHVPIPVLLAKTGYSQKHLIYLFKKQVGATPKYFQRINRFNRVLHQLHTQTSKPDWPDLIFKNNYYDQAHFIKEFRQFSGVTPREYLEAGSTCSKIIHTDISR
ncbi:MAG: DUF6597 domain-containing transcriptional factor [Prolixibacteraceae bacterium]